MVEARESRSGIVDRQTHARRAQGFEGVGERRVVDHPRVFGQLEHEPLGGHRCPWPPRNSAVIIVSADALTDR